MIFFCKKAFFRVFFTQDLWEIRSYDECLFLKEITVLAQKWCFLRNRDVSGIFFQWIYCSYRSPQYFGNGYEMSGYRLKRFPFSCATFELAYQLAFFTSKIFSKQYPTMAIKSIARLRACQNLRKSWLSTQPTRDINFYIFLQ